MSERFIGEIAERYERATYMIHRRLTSKVREALPSDMTPEQMYIIRYLTHQSQVTSTVLADMLCVEKSTITSTVGRLVNKGYIERMPSTEDRRVVYLILTDAGRKRHDELEEGIYRIILPYIQRVGEENALEYIKVLELVAEIFKDDME